VNEAWVKEFLTTRQDPIVQAFRQGEGKPSIAIVGVVAEFDRILPIRRAFLSERRFHR
jgi:hypothetical protein